MSYFLLIFSVLLGVILVLLIKPNKNLTRLLLAFSGAYLLSVTVLHLLPEVYTVDANFTISGIFILAGIILQSILESFSKGAEHGHVHISNDNSNFPWLLFISLCIHSFLEGFPIHQHNDMVYGVFIHKIPIAALLTSYLLKSKYMKKQAVAFVIIFTIMTPLGTLVSNSVSLDQNFLVSINALVIGIFLHISTTILFEASEGHKFNLSKLVAICLGVLIAYFI